MAVDRRGDTVATVTLDGIDPYDPEALAPGTDRRTLWLGDIGDNSVQRPDVSVFLVTEPRRLADRTVPAHGGSASPTPTGRTTPRRCWSTRRPAGC